jgi:multiple sugar transport system substrate-binding protein
MSKDARVKRGAVAAIAAAAAITLVAGCAGGSAGSSNGGSSAGGEVTLEFAQWWEPELPAGSLRKLMDRFESENPGI